MRRLAESAAVSAFPTGRALFELGAGLMEGSEAREHKRDADEQSSGAEVDEVFHNLPEESQNLNL